MLLEISFHRDREWLSPVMEQGICRGIGKRNKLKSCGIKQPSKRETHQRNGNHRVQLNGLQGLKINLSISENLKISQ